MSAFEGAEAGAGTGMAHDIAAEYEALADLLEGAGPAVWDAPSLCEGWRTREVVAHMTMPARYDSPAFMAELEANGGDFTRLSDTVAARDGALPEAGLLADLRSPVLHAWQPPGGLRTSIALAVVGQIATLIAIACTLVPGAGDAHPMATFLKIALSTLAMLVVGLVLYWLGTRRQAA